MIPEPPFRSDGPLIEAFRDKTKGLAETPVVRIGGGFDGVLTETINGPREMFDVRHILMGDCCLLDMKRNPHRWPMTEALSTALQVECEQAALVQQCLAASGVEIHRPHHLVADYRLQLQGLVGLIAMLCGRPVPIVFRHRFCEKPTKTDVVSTVCVANLTGYSDALLVYPLPTMRIFAVERNLKIFEQITAKSRRLFRCLLSGKGRECHHAPSHCNKPGGINDRSQTNTSYSR